RPGRVAEPVRDLLDFGHDARPLATIPLREKARFHLGDLGRERGDVGRDGVASCASTAEIVAEIIHEIRCPGYLFAPCEDAHAALRLKSLSNSPSSPGIVSGTSSPARRRIASW